MCRGTFGGEDAGLKRVAGASLKVYRVGAVADGAYADGAVQGVREEDWGLEADGRLGDHGAGAGNVAGLEAFDSCDVRQGAPVGQPDLSSKNSR